MQHSHKEFDNFISILYFKGPIKVSFDAVAREKLAITLHMYASIGPNLDNTHRGEI